MMVRIGAKVSGGREWDSALDLLLGRLDLGTRRAVKGAADELADRIRAYLHTYAHTKGTPTPSPPFVGPPAFVSGDLERSVTSLPASLEGRYQWTSMVFPDTAYDRIQELGGHSGRPRVYLPPRPYIGPMIVDSIVLGGVQRQFIIEWTRVIESNG